MIKTQKNKKSTEYTLEADKAVLTYAILVQIMCENGKHSEVAATSEDLDPVETFRLVEFLMLRIEYVDIRHSAKSLEERHSRCALVVTMVRSHFHRSASWSRRYRVTRHATVGVRIFGTYLQYILEAIDAADWSVEVVKSGLGFRSFQRPKTTPTRLASVAEPLSTKSNWLDQDNHSHRTINFTGAGRCLQHQSLIMWALIHAGHFSAACSQKQFVSRLVFRQNYHRFIRFTWVQLAEPASLHHRKI
jgi:hypothetical protein